MTRRARVSDIREAALLRSRDGLRKELQVHARILPRLLAAHARHSASPMLLGMDAWRASRIAQVLRRLATTHEKLMRLRDAVNP